MATIENAAKTRMAMLTPVGGGVSWCGMWVVDVLVVSESGPCSMPTAIENLWQLVAFVAFTTGHSTAMYQRHWIPVPSSDAPSAPNAERITVLQFNALAQSLCTSESFPFSPRESLTWAYRQTLLLQELKHGVYDVSFGDVFDLWYSSGEGPDVICMQECDQHSYETCFNVHLSAE
jgi:hypothetical protein